MKTEPILLENGQVIPVAAITPLDNDSFLQGVSDLLHDGWRVSSYCAVAAGEKSDLYCLLSSSELPVIAVIKTVIDGTEFPSLAAAFPQLQLFEREIAEQHGITFTGHPWFKPVRFVSCSRGDRDAWGRPSGEPIKVGLMDYYQVEGEEVHEVAVGPVHAGVIEPGHFRFQCHGEEVFHLEISLGYQHRGVEELLKNGPKPQSMRQVEAMAGDSSIGHGLAYCMALEGLAELAIPDTAERIRAVALELERLANHTGDLGAIAGDVGYLPTSSFCGRIRGDFLNMTALICGSRFGRGLLSAGGTTFGIDHTMAQELIRRLETAQLELASAVNLLWGTPSVMARLEGTGVVSQQTALELGLVGPAARACGLERDVRKGHPFGLWRGEQIQVAVANHGDVCSRSLVRWQECQHSLEFCLRQLRRITDSPHRAKMGGIRPDHLVVAMTEGWRGEICHLAITDSAGRFRSYKVCDPSFHNWSALAMALRNEQISDFPLCNKSFNLSYCGFDL